MEVFSKYYMEEINRLHKSPMWDKFDSFLKKDLIEKAAKRAEHMARAELDESIKTQS